ncbi:MAG TPA: NAD-dependent epimerase/dehydratase family protein [Sphingomicrobium sp.]
MLQPHVSQALRQSSRRIVITGASGWLGRATLDLLGECLSDSFDKRVFCFGSQARTIEAGNGRRIEQRPLAELRALSSAPTFVLHYAFLTKDRAEATDEAEYRAANRLISDTVLDALDAIGAEGVFVASSGAAGFAGDPAASPAMRLYGEMKRDDEHSFAQWADRTGKTAVVARIFNLSGPHINKHDSYALACFIIDALSGGPISVKAAYEVRRGFVSIRELLSLVFAMLLEGHPGARLFETGGAPMEMGEVAEAVAAALGGCGVERAARNQAAADIYLGDDRAYRALLEQYGIEPVPFAQQVVETARFLEKKQQLQVPAGIASGVRPW